MERKRIFLISKFNLQKAIKIEGKTPTKNWGKIIEIFFIILLDTLIFFEKINEVIVCFLLLKWFYIPY